MSKNFIVPDCSAAKNAVCFRALVFVSLIPGLLESGTISPLSSPESGRSPLARADFIINVSELTGPPAGPSRYVSTILN
jgi:hypothetical protein